jgi:hypothetical protein
MSQKMKKHSESVVPQDDEKIIPFVNNKSNSKIICIKDLFEKTTSQNKIPFDISLKINSKLKTNFEFLETKYIEVNRFELFEIVYQIVSETIDELQEVEIESFEELLNYSFKTLPLFLCPNNITQDEIKWSESILIKRTEDHPFGTKVEVPKDSELNYLINVKRILDRNKSNPFFNDSILDFLENH